MVAGSDFGVTINSGSQYLDPVDFNGPVRQIRTATSGKLGIEFVDLPLQGPCSVGQLPNLVVYVGTRCPRTTSATASSCRSPSLNHASACAPVNSFDPAHTGSDALLRDDVEYTDVAGPRDMGTAAEFDGEPVPHGQDPDAIRVLLAKQAR